MRSVLRVLCLSLCLAFGCAPASEPFTSTDGMTVASAGRKVWTFDGKVPSRIVTLATCQENLCESSVNPVTVAVVDAAGAVLPFIHDGGEYTFTSRTDTHRVLDKGSNTWPTVDVDLSRLVPRGAPTVTLRYQYETSDEGGAMGIEDRLGFAITRRLNGADQVIDLIEVQPTTSNSVKYGVTPASSKLSLWVSGFSY